jgi:hypothetical protein
LSIGSGSPEPAYTAIANCLIVAGTGEMGDEFADPGQVTRAHLFHHERIGRVQHEIALARMGLQWLEPGVDILGGKFGFEALQAAGPGIHV